MFSNMKIGMRLAVGFGIVVALLVAIAVIGLTRLASLNASLENITRDKWPKVLLLQDGLAGVNEIGLSARDLLLAADKAGQQRAKERILEARGNIGKSWEKLKPTLANPKGKEMFEQILAARDNYIAAQNQVIKLAEEGKGEEARAMCGNSVCQDRRFMARYMPRLEAWFHYRNLDVSTLKELCRRWRPEVAKAFSKRSAHTALADIAESIDELRHYRDGFLSIAPRN